MKCRDCGKATKEPLAQRCKPCQQAKFLRERRKRAGNKLIGATLAKKLLAKLGL